MPTPKAICVYCGASNSVAHAHLQAAFTFGQILGRAGIRLIYGGGRIGLMGRLADGVLAEGGRVTGIIPRSLARPEVAHSGLDELVVVETMHQRKEAMVARADAFVVLPGGLGTLDELFEVLTWRQLGFHRKPIVVADIDLYWTPLRALLEHIVAERYASPLDQSLLRFVDEIGAILPALLE